MNYLTSRITFLLYLIIPILSVKAQDNYTSGGVLSDLQSNMDIKYYGLHLEVNPSEKYLSGYTEVSMILHKQSDKVELDLVNYYDIGKILLGEKEMEFTHKDNKIFIETASLPAGKVLYFRIYYSGNPPEAPNAPWVGGFTWSQDSTGNHWVGVSCPNEGAKVFFPCKDHPSDRPDSVRLKIKVPEGYFCAANGLLEEQYTQNGITTFNWITHYPISNYNVNITIGDLVPVERTYYSVEGNTFPIVFYVLREKLYKAERHLDLAVDHMSTLEKYYGEYPFTEEKFGLAHTPYLGMEHQTINAYGNKFKYTEIRGAEFDWLMLHEMGHEWWANKVSCEDWSDYWIHEGICSYGDALYILDHFGEEEYQKKMANTRRGISNKKPIIPKRNASTDEVYQGDIYSKGAFMMHSLRFIMGDKKFFNALKGFATREENTYANLATTTEFIEYFSGVHGEDLRPFIEMFLYTNDLINPKIVKTNRGFELSIPNIDYDIPLEVRVNDKIEKYTVGKSSVIITSENSPEPDPNSWYLIKE